MTDKEQEIADLTHDVELMLTTITRLETEIDTAHQLLNLTTASLEMIAGHRQCIDNTMSDKAIARETLKTIERRKNCGT